MSTSLTKQGTSLTETSSEELKKLSQKAGVVPSTPAGAVSIGANQDQAKMTGTPAQKPSRIAGPEGEKTLTQQQRLTPPSQEAMTAPEKLERMKKLGTLNTQVEGLVQGYLQQIQSSQAALSLNQEALNVVPTASRAPLESALNEYKSALTEQQKEAAVIKAGNVLGHPLTAAELTSYFADSANALSKIAKNVTPDTVTMRDLHLSNSGVNIPSLAQDLGVSEDELSNLTLPQLNAKVEEIKRAEYAASDEAKAESLNAVGNRATQLEGERKALGQTGRTGYEAQFDELQNSIENASTIKVGGEEMTIDKLLSDENLSRLISDAAISPASLERLAKTEPALASFITQYKSSLIQLSGDAGLVASDIVNRQTEAHGLKQNVSDSLFEKMFGKSADIISADELATLKSNMQNSELWQALSKDKNLAARLELSPDSVDSLKSLNKDQINQVVAATKIAEASPVLASLAGYTPGGLLTPSQVDFVNQWKDEIQALPTSISSDPSFQKLIKEGTITEAGASLLATSPELWDSYRKEQTAVSQLGRVHNEDQFLEMLTGDSSFGLADFNDTMSALKAWAATGNQKAMDYYMTLQSSLTGPDGVLDMKDVKKALEGMQAAGQGIGGILEGKSGVSSLIKKLGSTIQSGETLDDPNSVTKLALDYLKDDQKIDGNELTKFMNSYTPEKAKELINSPWVQNKDELSHIYNESMKARLTPTISPLLDSIKFIPGLKISPENGALTGSTSYNYQEAMSGLNTENATIYRGQLEQLKAEYLRASNNLINDQAYAISVHTIDDAIKFINLSLNKKGVAPTVAPPKALQGNVYKDGNGRVYENTSQDGDGNIYDSDGNFIHKIDRG